jgi:hypothetical protein
MSLELEREETVQLLCRHFANDGLSTQELESRLDAVYRASSADELRALLTGLPALPAPTASAALAARSGAERVDRPAQNIRAIFSSVKKRGEWEPAPYVRAKAMFSELVLDFREARISPDVTTIDVKAAFSSVRIIVPPGVRVECDGSAVFGEFSEKTLLGAAPDVDAPTLRITGSVVFGEVSIVMRLPDEGELHALKREWMG